MLTQETPKTQRGQGVTIDWHGKRMSLVGKCGLEKSGQILSLDKEILKGKRWLLHG
jgi:hypothetical protein